MDDKSGLIYFITTSDYSSGYIGQDERATGGGDLSSGFPRVLEHIRNCYTSQLWDGAAELIKEQGVGGLTYHYIISTDFYGLGEENWNLFKQEYGQYIENDIDTRRNLAEFIWIEKYRGTASNMNKAIGGGGLVLNFNKWPAYMELRNQITGLMPTDERWEKELGDDKVTVRSFNDLIKGEARNKVLYSKQYKVWRLCLRAIPIIALIGKDNWLYNEVIRLLPSTVTPGTNFSIGKLNITERIKSTISTVQGIVDQTVKKDGIEIDINKYFSTEWAYFDELDQKIVNFINNAIRRLSKKNYGESMMLQRLGDNGPNSFLRKTFLANRESVMRVAGENKQEPVWYTNMISKAQIPPESTYLEDLIKNYAMLQFDGIYVSEIKNNPLPIVEKDTPASNIINSSQWLSTRIKNRYLSIFDANSSVMINWNMFINFAIANTQSAIGQHPVFIGNAGRTGNYKMRAYPYSSPSVIYYWNDRVYDAITSAWGRTIDAANFRWF